MQKIKAILFDLDDTLFDCYGLLVGAARRRAARAMVQAGLPCTEEEAYQKQLEVLEEHGPRFDVFDAMAQMHGMPPSLAQAALAAYNSEEVGDIQPFPDVPETLAELRSQGYRLLLLTTGVYARQQKKIEALGIKGCFDDILINDIEMGDHRDDCFQDLLTRHHLKPDEVLCVGDRVQSEIKSGNALGMITVQMLHGRFKDLVPKTELEEPDYKISRISELHYILRVVNRRNKGAEPRVVAVGGGTGLPVVLQGLKDLTSNLAAIVTVTDTGRSSGRIRNDFGVLPPGDMRNCLVALSDSSKLLNDLFQYRFAEGTLEGMNFGNLFIAAMAKVTGSFEAAVRETSRVLAIRGKVLPSSYDDVHLCAKLADGSLVESEVNVRQPGKAPITDVFLTPPDVKANEEAINEILRADLIVIGPGSLYTSVIANLLVPAIPEAIRASKAKKVYVCNIVTQAGQTDGYSCAQHIEAIERHLGERVLDAVLVNSNVPPPGILERYRSESSELVRIDDQLGSHRVQIILDDLVENLDHRRILWEKQNLLRHDPEKLAEMIWSLL
ncbi:MAG TPA: uridine diphosphate-N-acetylglucosamine-binding protein YvcK [Planctomycetota bacterium]|nr:uridine diphosphate-N-acetylglucosamine-binding protein YvcK [Planctomycetota bacterium]